MDNFGSSDNKATPLFSIAVGGWGWEPERKGGRMSTGSGKREGANWDS